MPLSEEQKHQIEQKRQEALAKRQKLANYVPHNISKPAQSSRPEKGAAWSPSSHGQMPSSYPLFQTGTISNTIPLSSLSPSTSKQVTSRPPLSRNTHTGTSTNSFYGSKVEQNANQSHWAPKYTNTTITIKVTAKFVLSDRETFKVEMAYHPGAIALFKTISSSRYNATERTWYFSLKDHNDLTRMMRQLQPEVQVDPLPRWVLETFGPNKRAFSNREDANLSINEDGPSVEPWLWDCLMPFQKDGVRYAINRSGRILLADDMGLGKTLQALAIVSAYKSKWPLFIVCPSSMRFAWKAAVVRWLPSIPEENIVVITSGKVFQVFGGADLALGKLQN